MPQGRDPKELWQGRNPANKGVDHKAISRGWEVGRDLRFKGRERKCDGKELCKKRKGCVCKDIPIHFTIAAVPSAYNDTALGPI